MKKFNIKEFQYLDIVILVIVGYIFLKIIDNLPGILNCIGSVYNIASPFIFGLVIAYILNPLVKLIEKRLKLNRGLSILLSYILIIGILTLSSVYLFPKLYSSILDIINNIPYITKTVQQWFNDFLQQPKIQDLINSGFVNINPNIIIPKISSIAMSSLNAVASTALSFTNSFIKVILGFLIAIYILFDKEKICDFFLKIMYVIFKERNGNILLEVLSNLNKMIGTYIGIKAIDSLIIAVLAFIGLSIIGSQYALLLAVIVGLTNMIPYIGPFAGILVGFLINVFVSPVLGFVVAGYLLLLQQFDAWILDPKLIGNKVGLSPLLVLFAVTLGGGFYGIIGMLLAAPIMSVIKIYLTKFLDNYNFNFMNKK
ncbi:Predicted PurR-regulated permease PerM [Clostridium cavendishii DSM 21758]|uniref:Predicted PurR-regulated permease PerM n=1 Tax=Clostridium cavendishii DSM 21758 TaxID=1121302 RepID=A0A1M6UUU8_9CLOT|nr:AI-2E family transporter [Clostridium cavendishii]SHK72964.1 Predicted PurR-regulated permease PerM [Clostridium cavendishii DSM 21758]